ncbi:hypothetical protein [Helicobacter cappadocius]|uniref:Uncharacterized protein n=1 Tax=Helicobacter cappadocius TaxID=3063998 RepID=A0AA90PK35_9HELI|nr:MULTISPECIES: hypothetical protein [unclassified Helicobacter]MDO7253046.1 hypothetical protein [Helicobacter sp. faydin-H75]MDP2538965.1 hypothetical protein [Helicobacter sp. faydin-H76]
MKKIVVILLSLGALLILILLGVGYKLSSEFRSKLQMSLNDSMIKINDEFSKNNTEVKFQPFVCSGLIGYECVSKNIEIIQKNTQEKLIGFSEATLSLEGLRRDSLEFSLSFPNLSLDFIDKELKEDDKHKVYDIFKPRSLVCNQKNRVLDKKTGEIQAQTKCNITTSVASYEINGIERIKSEKFVDKAILKSLLQYYSFAFDLKKESIRKPPMFYEAIDSISYQINSKNLKEFLYPIVQQYYQQKHQSSHEEFSDKTYEFVIENFKNLTGLILGATGFLGSPYQDGILQFVDGIGRMATGNASGVKISLVPKQEKAPYFNLSSDMLLNIEHQGTQQKIFAKIFNNYDLKTQIIPYETK